MKKRAITGTTCCFVFLCFILIGAWVLPPMFPKSAIAAQLQPRQAQNDHSMTAMTADNMKERSMTGEYPLSEEEGELLLKVARRTIEERLFDLKESEKTDTELPKVFREPKGTFVTLTIKGNLRGCIGHIIPRESLIDGIRINAINAAFKDPRFSPLSKEEWKKIKIEVSILTDPEPLSYSGADDLLDKLRPGVDGLIIKKGPHQATFLPQVWEQLPKKEEFLNHLCLKAGLDGDEWREGNLQVSLYQVQAFEE